MQSSSPSNNHNYLRSNTSAATTSSAMDSPSTVVTVSSPALSTTSSTSTASEATLKQQLHGSNQMLSQSPNSSPPSSTSDIVDTPLNLSKPKESPKSIHVLHHLNSQQQQHHHHHHQHPHHQHQHQHQPHLINNYTEQHLQAVMSSKMIPAQNLLMQRAFLPYSGLPPHLSPFPVPPTDRSHLSSSSSSTQSRDDKQTQPQTPPQQQPSLGFPLSQFYGLPTSTQALFPKPVRDESFLKDEADFMSACQSKILLII